eukprot:6626597-Lingulodinium_polyedra.AAC.1
MRRRRAMRRRRTGRSHAMIWRERPARAAPPHLMRSNGGVARCSTAVWLHLQCCLHNGPWAIMAHSGTMAHRGT